MTAPKKILNLFGDVMRLSIQQIRNMVSLARNDENEWDVRGLSFPEDPPDTELDTVSLALGIGIPSDLFDKEMYKKAAGAALRDANPETIHRINQDIDAAPSRAEAQAAELQQRASMVVSKSMGNQVASGI